MRLLTLTVLAWALACSTSSAQPARYRYDYLTDAVNRMFEVVDQRAEPTPEALETATTTACNALTRLLKDPNFSGDMQLVAKADTAKEDRRALASDLTRLTLTFLPVERKVLQDAGLSGTAVERLLWAMAATHTAIANDVPSEAQMRADIERLQRELCAAAAQIGDAQRRRQAQAQRATWALRLGGIAIVLADSAAAVATEGVAAVIVASSATSGAAMAGWTLGK